MRKVVIGLLAAILPMALPVAAWAEDSAAATAPAAAATAQHYTTAETPLGTLLDDPAAKAVLENHIPQLIANEQIQMARQITLKDIQGFAPNVLSDDTLAAIDSDLAKLPAK
jgi:hypothetical protein